MSDRSDLKTAGEDLVRQISEVMAELDPDAVRLVHQFRGRMIVLPPAALSARQVARAW